MENILDASASPDDNLAKEVYAHFGLCMYLAQVFETGLINMLTALETAVSKKPTRQTFDALYVKHEALTFGNIMKALSAHNFLPKDLEEEIKELKGDRDHLAHRFFRDHDLDLITVGGSYVMIQELVVRRDRFARLDRKVSALEDKAFERIGFDPDTMRTKTKEILAEMEAEAHARYSSKIE